MKMNNREKIVQKQFLNNEQAVIKRLNQVYNVALDDITGKVAELDTSIATLQKAYADIGDEIGPFASTVLKNAGAMTPEEAKETIASRIQSKVYQKKYQTALKTQVSDILDKMQTSEFLAVSDYLEKCYEEGFVGTMYNLQGQGIPLAFPIDQEAMVRAVQLDSKISQGLYTRLGEDVDLLKKKITAQVSRSIATGMSYQMTAKQLAGYTRIGYNNAVRIARTEGHRVQVQSTMDACYKAKDVGADVVKQWDAALDDRTRESHVAVDGEIRELDEKFSNGLMYPGDPSGGAAEVVNCRCALNQRARAFLNRDVTKWDGIEGKLVEIEADKYEDFKKEYFKIAETNAVQGRAKTIFTPAKTLEEAQAYAERFVSSRKTTYSGYVDYGKIDVDVANDINEVLTEIFDEYDAPPMTTIQLMNMREKKWRMAEAEAAYGFFSGDLYFNGKYYKNAKTIATRSKEYSDLLGRVMPNVPDKIRELEGKKDGTSKKKARYLQALLDTGRTNVFTVDTKGTIIHEMGHMLDSKVFGLQRTTSTFDMKGSMDKYAGKISAYATESPMEYVAESFAAYWKGEKDILDPELVKIFEGARKK